MIQDTFYHLDIGHFLPFFLPKMYLSIKWAKYQVGTPSFYDQIDKIHKLTKVIK